MRLGRPLSGIIILLLFFFSLSLGAAERTDIVRFLDATGLELQWDPYLEIGNLSLGYKSLSFKVGQPWLLSNYVKKIYTDPLTREKGTLFMTKETEEAVKAYFFPKRDGGPRIGALFIDPGHGGKDPGTIGKHRIGGKEIQLDEKDIVLNVSKELGSLLRRKFPEKQVVLSREDDRYLTLEERPELANSIVVDPLDAVVFISIHANASLNDKAKGYEVWYLPPDYRRSLLEPKKVESDSKDILPILNTMLEEEFTIESVLLAKYILKGLDESIGNLTDNRGLKDESWFVVRKAKMPSVLVEIGFVTNPEEAALLSKQEHLNKIARAIYNGIVSFVEYFENASARGNGL